MSLRLLHIRWLVLLGFLSPGPVFAQPAGEPAALYRVACAACHGSDGTGAPATQRAFEEEVPDFSECTFASREPDADWAAVILGGGPVRAFSRMMPAFGDALTERQVQDILDHVRTFCVDGAWPRGELNLPRPFGTEKAYPEDEAVWTTSVAAEGPAAVLNEIVYERRIGARGQVEVKVPFGVRRQGDDGTLAGGLGDLAFAYKHTLAHGLRSGSIFSIAAELIVPTGDATRGFGGDATILEPFVAFGRILPADAFLHAQAGAELPIGGADAGSELFGRFALGRTFTQGAWGRAWSPMLEFLATRELEGGADIAVDIVPQMQVTLNTRQHVMLSAGVRIPLDDSARNTQLLLYVLWDWFDGGLFDGW